MSAPFHMSEIFDDVEDMAWFTSNLLSSIVNEHAPVKCKVVKKESVPYMNSRLRKAIYSRNMARNKFRKYGADYWEDYRKKRNEAVKIRKLSLGNYFSENCAKKDKKFWTTISPFFSNKHQKGGDNIILNDNDKLVVDSNVVSNIFNYYFVNIASSIGFDDSIVNCDDSIKKHKNHASITKIIGRFGGKCNTFSFKPVSSAAIKNKLKSINVRKATGFDNIPGKLLRVVNNELSRPLANLINECMSQNVFPECMKCAELCPIFKKNYNLIKGNYRPVSILTTLSKIYESVMNDQMVDHFNVIFDNLLSAFRKGYSCQSILIKCIDDWKVALDENKFVGALFMDLSKAFDCLPHGLLISKLHAYGLDIHACELVAS